MKNHLLLTLFFVNEDMTFKIKTYKENNYLMIRKKIMNKIRKNMKKRKKKKKNEKNPKQSIKYEDELINKLLNVKEYVKKEKI